MKYGSFGKEQDCPIQKRNEQEGSDIEDFDGLDSEDENDNKENNNSKENKSQFKEIELNPNDPKIKNKFTNSASEDNDSDKNSNDENKNNINIINDNNVTSKGKEDQETGKFNDKDKQINTKKNDDDEDSDSNESNKDSSENELFGDKDEKEVKEVKEEKAKTQKNENKIINKKEDDEFSKEIKKNQEIEKILLESIKNKENATIQKIDMANEIDFKAIPDQIIPTDEFGFIIKNDNNKSNSDIKNGSLRESVRPQSELLLINARMEKWSHMIKHYDEYAKKKYDKLKSRTRKGIPDCFRSHIWQIFAKKEKYYKKDVYNQLNSVELDEDTKIVIIKDLDRTFPALLFFREKYGKGQRELYRVLSNYSKYNKETGYLQGMGFIVAVFLSYMDEESSFFMLDSLMKNYGLEGYYKPNFPDLKKTFYILLNLMKKFIPKVYELFRKEGMMPSMYASEWFICIFSRNLEFNSLVRIFDVFLLEGFKVIYRFALAFLKMKEEKFLAGKDGLASIMQTMNECTENIDVEKVFKIAFGFSLSRDYIEKKGIEYNIVKNNKNDEFIKQL